MDVPGSLTSVPSLKLRVWDLWDDTNGGVTRGYAGTSIVWPWAMWFPSGGPPPSQLYLLPCNATDPLQQWGGGTFSQSQVQGGGGGGNGVSWVKNRGRNQCISAQGTTDPVQVLPCGPESAAILYNRSVSQLQFGRDPVLCLDVNHAEGPDIDIYECHPPSHRDFKNQQYDFAPLAAPSGWRGGGEEVEGAWGQLESVSAPGRCLTLSNHMPPSPSASRPSPAS